MNYQLQERQESIELEARPFAAGGEGNIHDILSPQPLSGYVAKIIHPHKRNSERVAKLRFLQQNRPEFSKHAEGETPGLIWVEDFIVDDKGEVIGFIMPRVEGEVLELLCSPRLPRTAKPEWKPYERGTTQGQQIRLRVCYRLAELVAQLHATGLYVLSDLKPDNVLVRPNGSVSLVDLDSMEIRQGGRTLFAATVATPDYTPPEYYTQGIEPGKKPIEESWDRFSLAVIFYRIMLGVHPFAASCKAPYDDIVSLADKIRMGFFVHDAGKAQYFSVVPPPHAAFSNLDEGLRFGFVRTFDAGHDEPSMRITAAHWLNLLQDSPLLLAQRPLPTTQINLPSPQQMQWLDKAYELAVYPQNSLFDDENTKPSNEIPPPIDNKKNTLTILFMVAGVLMLALGLALSSISLIMLAIVLGIGGTVSAKFTTAAASRLIESPEAKENWKIPKFERQNYDKITNARQLEDLQHELFAKRLDLRQALRQTNAEGDILEQIYKKRRRELLAPRLNQINITLEEIQKASSSNSQDPTQLDQQATQLIRREADEINRLYQQTKQQLDNHPIFSQLLGGSPQQKLIQLPQFLQAQKDLTSEERQQREASLSQDLQIMQQNLHEDISKIQNQYAALHQDLKQQAQQQKKALQEAIRQNVLKIQKAAQLDNIDEHDPLYTLISERYEIQQRRKAQEAAHEQINEELRRLRHRLQRLA